MGTKRKLKSPFMLILLSTLLLYSLTLIKRLKKQKQNYGKKQSVFPNFLSDYFSSYYENTVTLYIITPTYPRPEQLPELTRLSQTLMVSSFLKYKILKYVLFCRPVQDTFKKYLDTDTFKILSEKSI